MLVAAEDLGLGRCAPEPKPGPSSTGPSSTGPSSTGPSSSGPSPFPLLAQDRDRPAGADLLACPPMETTCSARSRALPPRRHAERKRHRLLCTTALRMGPCALHRVNMAAALGAVLGSAVAGPLPRARRMTARRSAEAPAGRVSSRRWRGCCICPRSRRGRTGSAVGCSRGSCARARQRRRCAARARPSVALATASAAGSAAGGRRGEGPVARLRRRLRSRRWRYAVFLSSMEIGTTVSGWARRPLCGASGS